MIALVILAAFGVAGSRTLHVYSDHGGLSTASVWSVPCEGETPSTPAPDFPRPTDDRGSHDDCLFCQSQTMSVATVVAPVDAGSLIAPAVADLPRPFDEVIVVADAARPRAARAPPIA